jgi:hypothetical protein
MKKELILIEVTPWSTAVEIQGPGDFFRYRGMEATGPLEPRVRRAFSEALRIYSEGRNLTPAAKQRLRRRFRKMVERGSTE